ncbi:MAG: right-handed parallel beta-helix repeat-containing protein [Planctomycetes bacterium]|nr:right-handed parallel beta-helix repeat-containing protein [Planctomycetota bacterium]
MYKTTLLLTFVCLVSVGASSNPASNSSTIAIGPFAQEYSASHQQRIQTSLDDASGSPCIFTFAPGDYAINNPKGLRVPNGATLIMEGARFVLSKDMQQDGQCFIVENSSNISFRGGEIIGQRDVWDPGTNLAGVRVFGDSHDIHFTGMKFKNLTSNGIGVFGESDDKPIRNVTLINVTGINCCNYYGDYLDASKGTAPGSHRHDQGTVAFYYVDGWLVDGCRFEKSQSDGTHFYHSHNGKFVNCVVADSQMGGYFLEGCRHVLASENTILRNGSRGVTIERDSIFCTLNDNLIAYSGREGLWAPDVMGVIVTANIFRENGQKDDAQKDCEIRIDDEKRFKTIPADILITGNIFYTKAHQTAAIFLAEGVKDITINNNLYNGAAPQRCTASS